MVRNSNPMIRKRGRPWKVHVSGAHLSIMLLVGKRGVTDDDLKVAIIQTRGRPRENPITVASLNENSMSVSGKCTACENPNADSAVVRGHVVHLQLV